MEDTSRGPISWQEEVRTAFKTAGELSEFLGYELPELEGYPVFIPRSFAQKIKDAGPLSILSKQFLPHAIEKDQKAQEKGFADPISDEKNFKVSQIIHRYQNRALFTPTTKCPINCRYCFRKNELFSPNEIFKPGFEKALLYLEEHKEINEIIFSGGDPLFLSNKKIKEYLESFSKLSHIKYIRFHSRFPVILPQRLDQELSDILTSFKERFQKIMMVIHINHADEITDDLKETLKKFKIHFLAQSVLLKGINDDKETLTDLFYKLDSVNIRPYYLHHPDKVKGAMHFTLSLSEGRKIFHEIRNEVPGWLLPTYVLDVEGGLGKIPAQNPEHFDYRGTLLDRFGNTHEIEL